MERPHDSRPTADEIHRRHRALLDRLRGVAERHGHDPDRLRIVAVTKTHPVELVRSALRSGLTMLGESRVQEAERKVAAEPGAEWHLIGRLQSNKARRAVGAFKVIHSVDTLGLLDRIDRLAAEEGRAPRVLLQVNVTGQTSTAGLSPASLDDVEVPRTVPLVGLMTIAPMAADEREARATFAALRQLRDALEQRLGIELPELSMGMSADAEAAAAEGATLVRVGTALFGPRAETLLSSPE
jgi:pyridoxal phosphate enzyme (YggS family)